MVFATNRAPGRSTKGSTAGPCASRPLRLGAFGYFCCPSGFSGSQGSESGSDRGGQGPPEDPMERSRRRGKRRGLAGSVQPGFPLLLHPCPFGSAPAQLRPAESLPRGRHEILHQNAAKTEFLLGWYYYSTTTAEYIKSDDTPRLVRTSRVGRAGASALLPRLRQSFQRLSSGCHKAFIGLSMRFLKRCLRQTLLVTVFVKMVGSGRRSAKCRSCPFAIVVS